MNGAAVQQDALPDPKTLRAQRLELVQAVLHQALGVETSELRHVFPLVVVAVPRGPNVIGTNCIAPDGIEDVALRLVGGRVSNSGVLLEGVAEFVQQHGNALSLGVDVVHAAVGSRSTAEVGFVQVLNSVAELGDDFHAVPVLDREALESVEHLGDGGVVDGGLSAEVDLKGDGVVGVVCGAKLDVVLGERVVVVEIVGAGLRTAVFTAAGAAICLARLCYTKLY